MKNNLIIIALFLLAFLYLTLDKQDTAKEDSL